MSLSKKQREELRNLFSGRCAYCGKKLDKIFHADHVEALFRGWSRTQLELQGRNKGKDEKGNLFPACPRCNHLKATYTVEEFRTIIYSQIGLLRKYDNHFRAAEDFGIVQETGSDIVFWFEQCIGGTR